jgi:hypothetical protein
MVTLCREFSLQKLSNVGIAICNQDCEGLGQVITSRIIYYAEPQWVCQDKPWKEFGATT